MFPHKQAISAAYLIIGLYFGYVVIRDLNSIVAGAEEFFDQGPAWYADASVIAMAAAPFALLATAFMLHRMARWWLIVIPAVYGTLLTIGYITIALAVYLTWYLSVAPGVPRTPDAEGRLR